MEFIDFEKVMVFVVGIGFYSAVMAIAAYYDFGMSGVYSDISNGRHTEKELRNSSLATCKAYACIWLFCFIAAIAYWDIKL